MRQIPLEEIWTPEELQLARDELEKNASVVSLFSFEFKGFAQPYFRLKITGNSFEVQNSPKKALKSKVKSLSYPLSNFQVYKRN